MMENLMKVLRIGQDTDQREMVQVTLVGHPDWESARVTMRLRESSPLLSDLYYGRILKLTVETVPQ